MDPYEVDFYRLFSEGVHVELHFLSKNVWMIDTRAKKFVIWELIIYMTKLLICPGVTVINTR